MHESAHLQGVYYAAGAEVKYQVLQATPPSATVRLSGYLSHLSIRCCVCPCMDLHVSLHTPSVFLLSPHALFARVRVRCVYMRAHAHARTHTHTHTQVRIQVRLSTKVDNVAGVKIPVFQRVDVDAKDSSALVGLARGGQKLEDARTSFKKALDSLVVLASLQTSYVALDAAQKLTNRRVNALEYVVIPRLEDTVCACVCVRAWGPARVDTPAPPLALRCRHIRCGISRPSSMKWNARTS